MEGMRSLKKLQLNQNYDRISCLHDSILHHILSLLPAKDVVQTTLLSKRWQHLWKSLPYFRFIEHNISNKERFMNFVDSFLHHHDNSSMIEFQLSGVHAFDPDHLNAWIRAAVSGRVQKLDIFTGLVNIHTLPSCLFTCNSLVSLTLNTGSVLQFPEFFCFPRMKTMHLTHIIAAKNFSHQLLNCPNLKNLSLHRFIFNVKSSPTSYTVHHSGTLSNLEEADIGFVISFYHTKILWASSGVSVGKFIGKLSNVKVLSLGYSCIKILDFERDLWYHLPTFCNLKKLKLMLGSKKCDVEVMGCLLRCTPVLESLSIRFPNFEHDYITYKTQLLPQAELPSVSLPPSLKWVRIHGVNGGKNHIELVRILLENENLKEIIVQLYTAAREPTKLRQKLLGLPRSSSSCCVYVTE